MRSDAFVEAQFDAVMLDGAAVIFQGFGASGLPAGNGHGQVADFHALGRGEEKHVGRVVVERIAEAAFVDDEGAHAGALGLDGAGKAGGAGADADDVVGVVHLGTRKWRGGRLKMELRRASLECRVDVTPIVCFL